MSGQPAARVDDTIEHASLGAMIGKAFSGLVAGIVVGAAVTAAVAAVGFTGPLGMVVGALILSSPIVEKAEEAISDGITKLAEMFFPPTPSGPIATGSSNVFINKKAAARAGADVAACKKDGKVQLGEGSATVFINGCPAHRQGDRECCGAKTVSGSGNVFIGGEPQAICEIADEMPGWLNKVAKIAGYAQLAISMCRGRKWAKIPCVAKMLGIGFAVDYVISAIGSPVHVSTGAKFLDGSDDTDFLLPSRLPVEWVRRYSSLDTRPDSPLGPGWSLPYSVQLKLNQPGESPNIFIDRQAREVEFDALEPGEARWNSTEGYRLIRTPGGHYIVEDADGVYYDFAAPLHDGPHVKSLERLEDRNGNWIALHYDAEGRLHQLADCAGHVLECDYHAVHTRRMVGVRMRALGERTADGKAPKTRLLVRYEYDGSGRLKSVYDEAGERVRDFAYADAGPGRDLMIRHRLPGGLECFYEWAAFADHPRVVRHWSGDGRSWNISYILPTTGKDAPEVPAGRTTARDHLGRIQSWRWGSRYHIFSYADALDQVTRFTWDNGLITACVLPNGGRYTYEYDERGNLTAETDPLGHTRKTVWHPDFPLPLSETDPLGRTQTYEYDPAGNLLRLTDPLGQVTEYTRDEQGQVRVITDPAGGRTRLAWNHAGQIIRRTDCSDKTSRYEYNHREQPEKFIDAVGHVTSYRFDPRDRLTGLTLPDGSEERYAWDAADRLTEQVDGLNRPTRYVYNSRDQLLRRIDALGHTVSLDYDAAGNAAGLTNENNEEYRFAYDAADRLVMRIGLDGRMQRFVLDSFGLPLEVRQAAGDPEEIVLRFERDLTGRLLRKITPETVTSYVYDAAGQVIEVRRVAAPESQDAPERFLDAVRFEYDALGRLTAEETEVSPDLATAGLWRERITRGEGADDAPEKAVIRHEYDPLDNRAATVLPDGQVLAYDRCIGGHLQQITLDDDIVSVFERSDLHLEVLRSQGRLHLRTSYDALSRRAVHWAHRRPLITPWSPEAPWRRISHPAGGDVVLKGFVYDAAGELERRNDALLGEVRYDYDPVRRVTGARTEPSSAHRLPVDERYAYDPAGNLVATGSQDGPWWEQPLAEGVRYNRLETLDDIRCSYDAHGRLIRRDAGGTSQYFTYNSEHQLLHVRSVRRSAVGVASEQTYFAYDALGRRIAKRSSGNVTRFVWDGMRLLQERRKGLASTYVYEENAQEETYAPLARLDTPCSLDKAFGKVSLSDNTPKSQFYYYHVNTSGQPEELTDADGKVVWQARYAAWGQIVYEKSAPGIQQNLRFQGQYFDSETGLCYNTFRYYDPGLGRFITEDPIGLSGGINLYQYGPNPLMWIDPWGWSVISNTPLGKILDPVSERTGKTHQGQQIYKVKSKVEIDNLKLKKGDYYYLDNLHRDHIEIFSSTDKSKGVLNLDGTYNEAKSKKATKRKGPGCN